MEAFTVIGFITVFVLSIVGLFALLSLVLDIE